MVNYYSVLQVKQDATQDEIKKATFVIESIVDESNASNSDD